MGKEVKHRLEVGESTYTFEGEALGDGSYVIIGEPASAKRYAQVKDRLGEGEGVHELSEDELHSLILKARAKHFLLRILPTRRRNKTMPMVESHPENTHDELVKPLLKILGDVVLVSAAQTKELSEVHIREDKLSAQLEDCRQVDRERMEIVTLANHLVGVLSALYLDATDIGDGTMAGPAMPLPAAVVEPLVTLRLALQSFDAARKAAGLGPLPDWRLSADEPSK